MNKKALLKVALLSGVCLMAGSVTSQAQPKYENLAGNLSSARFVVNTPASLVGLKKITLATWGAAGPVMNVPVVKAFDTLAANPLLNGTGSYPSLTGKFALIYRGGGINFTDKVIRAVNAGATGVIIVNNVPGDPIAMGAVPTTYTTTIPVVMITDVDGNAINAAINGGTSVTVSIGAWGLGYAHDLGLLNPYQVTPHALNIPLSQMVGSISPISNTNYIGGAIANYGTSTETNVAVADSVYFTPTGGSASYIGAHTYNVASIAPSDSVAFGFGTAPYTMAAPSNTGRYDYKYSISYSNTDGLPQDNSYTMTQYVTDSVFCKGQYDYTKGMPITGVGIQPASTTTNFMMGSMFYIKNGGYAARKAQFVVSKNNVTTLDGETVSMYLYKWTDGSNGNDLDSFVQVGELHIVGYTRRTLSTADTSGAGLTETLLDTNGVVNNVILDSNSWYWTAVELGPNCFIGMDKNTSYFTRDYAQFVAGGSVPASPVAEHAEAAIFTDRLTMEGTPTTTLTNRPFSTTAAYGNPYYIDSIFFDKYNETPAVALLLSKNQVPTGIQNTIKAIGKVDVYPNPASDATTVSVNLDKHSNKVVYRFTDALGRTLYTETHSNVQVETFKLNTAPYASGNYYLFISTDNGSSAKKITLVK